MNPAKTPEPAAAVLLNPGPVNVHPEVRKALQYPDVCHREPEVAELMRQVRAKVTAVCGGGRDHAGVLLTGSGTAALESALSSIVPATGKILVLDNGHYGQRLHEIVTTHGTPNTHLSFGWANPIDLGALDRELASDSGLTHVALVHHETSTGMLNPLRAVGEIVARHSRSLAVDAISSLGSERLDLGADHVDWCIGTANKCLEGLPGISFVVAPRARLAELRGRPPRTYYLDLDRHFNAQEHENAPAFTPPVQILYAFDRALDLMLAETVEARGRRYAARAAGLRAALDRLGFPLLLGEGQMSNAVTVAQLPKGVEYGQLHDALKRRGFVVYATQRQLGASLRVASMGQLSADDVTGFVAALEAALAELRSQQDFAS